MYIFNVNDFKWTLVNQFIELTNYHFVYESPCLKIKQH